MKQQLQVGLKLTLTTARPSSKLAIARRRPKQIESTDNKNGRPIGQPKYQTGATKVWQSTGRSIDKHAQTGCAQMVDHPVYW